MSFFVTDKFLSRSFRKTNHTDKAIKAVNVRENIAEEKYLYVVEKIAICIFLLFIVCNISFLTYLNERNQGGRVTSVVRDNQYSLVIEKKEGVTENVEIYVPERELTAEEKEKILQNVEEQLKSKILGKNQDLDHIYYKLNLINQIDENDVAISWDTSDSTVIDYEGNIGSNTSKKGQLVKLEATLVLENTTKQVNYWVTVFPSRDKMSIKEFLQNYVENSNVSDKEIKLPETINKEKVKYFENNQRYSDIIVIIGMILIIVVYFLKDRDLEKILKERNKQMVKDYPEIVGKILLFYGAGLSMKMTIESIVREYENEKTKNRDKFRYAYEELIITLNKMKTGVSEQAAIIDYGNRCGLHHYIRLANIIDQNLRRGTRDIMYALKVELNNAMSERKNNGLKSGNEISTKLLGPMLVMLIVAIAIVIVPAFMSMSF